MARVFLVNPPSPERTPLPSFGHLAAPLRAAGHEVALLDGSAPHDHDEIYLRVASFVPDLVGIHLETLHVQPAYALARALSRFALVAGGPHATIVPDEVFSHGFRYAIRGESEHALVELADSIDAMHCRATGREFRALSDIEGLSWNDRGVVRHNPAR